METQTRFDLNAAIADWQQELAAQPDLTPVVRRELETHLHDTIAELQKRGLNDEESFWLARRRTGRPQQIGEEFSKADPENVWKDRVFWVAIGLLFVNFWGTFLNQFTRNGLSTLHERVTDFLPGWVSFYLPNWLLEFRIYNIAQPFLVLLHAVPVFLLAILLANHKLKSGRAALNFIVFSRARFVVTTLGAFLLVNSFGLFSYGSAYISFQLPWVVSLIGLAAWLIPSKKATVAKPA